MAGSLNRVELIGRVGKDPESRTMRSGGEVVSFSLATSENWRDKQSGERKEATQWHNIVSFNEGLNKIISAYVRKGSLIYLSGQLQTRSYEKDSSTRYVTEVVLQRFRGELQLLDSKQEGGSSDGGGYGEQSGGYGGGSSGGYGGDDPDDEIPF